MDIISLTSKLHKRGYLPPCTITTYSSYGLYFIDFVFRWTWFGLFLPHNKNTCIFFIPPTTQKLWIEGFRGPYECMWFPIAKYDALLDLRLHHECAPINLSLTHIKLTSTIQLKPFGCDLGVDLALTLTLGLYMGINVHTPVSTSIPYELDYQWEESGWGLVTPATRHPSTYLSTDYQSQLTKSWIKLDNHGWDHARVHPWMTNCNMFCYQW